MTLRDSLPLLCGASGSDGRAAEGHSRRDPQAIERLLLEPVLAHSRNSSVQQVHVVFVLCLNINFDVNSEGNHGHLQPEPGVCRDIWRGRRRLADAAELFLQPLQLSVLPDVTEALLDPVA